jgi:23S rRNA G2445 N2-methylase RlmL
LIPDKSDSHDINVVGIDLGHKLIDIARANAFAAGMADRLRFEVGNAARLRFEDIMVTVPNGY